MMHEDFSTQEGAADSNGLSEAQGRPMETTPTAQYAQDQTGDRVMRNDTPAPQVSFVRMRRCRRAIFGIAAVMVIVVLVTVIAVGGRAREGLNTGTDAKENENSWQLVGTSLRMDPTSRGDLNAADFTSFGTNVKIDMDANRLAVAAQGVNRGGGAVHVFSHLDPEDQQAHPNQWFLEVILPLPTTSVSQVSHDKMAMDMSEDGSRIVFNQGNAVYVYYFDFLAANHWSLLGPPIQMPSSHPVTTTYGSGIAMSGDGRYIAVLGYSESGTENALVDVFHYDSTEAGAGITDTWSLVYSVSLNSREGASLALDTAGRRLAIGEAGGQADDNLGPSISVHSRQSDLDPTSWTQSSSALTAEDGLVPTSDSLGKVVSISGDGSRIAYGTVDGQGGVVGLLEARPPNQASYWVSMGSVGYNGSAEDRFGASVALSMDGTRVAVGGPGAAEAASYGQLFLYEVNQVGQWTETVPPKRSVTAGDALGTSIALDQHGLVVAAGAPETGGVAVAFRIQP